ncbi:hypothetical protein D3C71_1498490 [compost metagenome]
MEHAAQCTRGMQQGLRAVQKAGFIVQREDDAVQLEQHLIGLDLGLQLALLLGQGNCAAHGVHPDADRFGERITHIARTIVKLHRATDVQAAIEAAGFALLGGAAHPARHHVQQTGQAARCRQGGAEDLTLEPGVVFTHDRALQLFQ